MSGAPRPLRPPGEPHPRGARITEEAGRGRRRRARVRLRQQQRRQIGPAPATHHPEQVRALVADEPPVFGLLPDAAHWRDVLAQVDAAHRTGGVGLAMETFDAAMGMRGGEQEVGGPPPPPWPGDRAVRERTTLDPPTV